MGRVLACWQRGVGRCWQCPKDPHITCAHWLEDPAGGDGYDVGYCGEGCYAAVQEFFSDAVAGVDFIALEPYASGGGMVLVGVVGGVGGGTCLLPLERLGYGYVTSVVGKDVHGFVVVITGIREGSGLYKDCGRGWVWTRGGWRMCWAYWAICCWAELNLFEAYQKR